MNSTEFCLILQRVAKQSELQMYDLCEASELIMSGKFAEKRNQKIRDFETGIADAMEAVSKLYSSSRGNVLASKQNMTYEEAQSLIDLLNNLSKIRNYHSASYTKAVQVVLKGVKQTYESRNNQKLTSMK